MQALILSVRTVLAGSSVLVHCRQGRHRSAAFASFLLALLHLCSEPQEPQELSEAELSWQSALHMAWESVPKTLNGGLQLNSSMSSQHSS